MIRTNQLSKFPPSPSGIALYASVFRQVLAARGPVRPMQCPPDPRTTQQLRWALRGLVVGATLAPSTCDVVQVELGGRGLYEFFVVQGLLLRRRRPWVSVTCHDLPTLAGPPLLVRPLDRRGTRRLGMWLSRTIGARLECRLLRGADSVFALTVAGATQLATRSGRCVHSLPHVLDDPERPSKQRQVFVPGYTDAVAELVALAGVVQRASGWSLVIGSCAPWVAAELQRQLPGAGSGVRMLGQVTESTLLDTYATAAVVVRLRGSRTTDGDTAGHAASGPLAWAIARSCICITDDSRSGAIELAAAGLVTRTDDPAAALAAVLHDAIDRPGAGVPLSALHQAARAGRMPPAVATAYWSAVTADLVSRAQPGPTG